LRTADVDRPLLTAAIGKALAEMLTTREPVAEGVRKSKISREGDKGFILPGGGGRG